MSNLVQFAKVVSSLPGTLTPNTLYAVRVPNGFKFYITDITGVAYPHQATNTVAYDFHRNKLINSSFAIAQRIDCGLVVPVSNVVTLTAGQYGHDRWKAGANGCTYSYATVNNQTTITITAGSLQQVVLGSNLQSGSYYLSWTGTSVGSVGGSSTLGNSNYGANYGYSVTGGNNLTVEFGVGTLSKPQLETNTFSTASPYEVMESQEEFFRCLPYLQVTGAKAANKNFYISTGFAFGATNAQFPMALLSPMIATPTVQYSNLQIAYNIGGGNNSAVSGPLPQGLSLINGMTNLTVTISAYLATLPVGAHVMLNGVYSTNWYLALVSEL